MNERQGGTMSDIIGTPPDTHCWDDDSGKDCWSYSPRLVAELLAAERNEIERLRGLLERAAVDLVRADNERAQIVASERERWTRCERICTRCGLREAGKLPKEDGTPDAPFMF
jgi:hypothetical protein